MKKLVALLAATLSGALTLTAATPVAVWDRDFSTMDKGTFTLSENGNTKESGYLQISGDNGILLTSTDALNVFTVIARCEGLNLSAENGQVLFTSYANDTVNNNDYRNLTGVFIPANNDACRGIWSGAAWDPSSSTAGYSQFEHGAMPANYTTLIYNHQQTGGTYAYALGPTSDVDDTVVLTTLYSILGLRSSGTTYYGCAIGGLRATTSAAFLSATGLKITSLAVFSGTLTEAEMKRYCFPSETQTIDVSTDTTVSAINAQFDSANYKAAAVSVADGVTITVDAAFSEKILSVSSSGTITLSAASQPDASYYSGVKFDIQGKLLRSWLTPGVVGVNFNKAQGNVVSGELVTSDSWVAATDANGTSTAMFPDGLTKVTWSASNTYRYNGSDSESSSFLHSYLDDGVNKGNGVEIYIDNVPYETYDVVIYASTDTSNARFQAKTVNGTAYTVDASGAVSAGNAIWGQSRLETPIYGQNAMRIKNLSGPLAIYGGLNTYSSDGARGGIAAIQIMPPTAEDNIAEYALTLNGTATNWSEGTWKIGETTVAAPTSGYVTINLTASTTLTVDESVSLVQLTVNAAEDAVLTLVNGESGSLVANYKVVVESGVLQQGSATVLGATPVLEVEDGATFDMNGLGINASTKVYLAGAGAGNWPWALTSSSGAGGAILGGLYLSANATIGGANELKVGKTDNGYYCYLRGFTLTKTGVGAFTATNMNTPGTGTIEVQGGAMSVNQWNNLNSASGDTVLTLREGASFTQNSSSHQVAVNTLNFLGGGVNTPNPLYIKSSLVGGGETARLVFRDGASTSLTGNLTVTTALTLDGAMAFNKDENAANDVVVTASGTMSSSSAISVGAGVTLNLGTNRPAGVITVVEGGTLAVKMLDDQDVINLAASAMPSSVVLYDANGDTVANPRVTYSEGLLAIMPTTPTLEASGTTAFDTAANWVGSNMPAENGDAIIELSGDAEITVVSDYTLGDLVVSGAGEVSFSGAGSVTAANIYLRNGATLVRSATISAATGINLDSGTVLKLNDVTESAVISGSGAVETYGNVVLAAANFMTGGITVKSGSSLSTSVEPVWVNPSTKAICNCGFGPYNKDSAYSAQSRVTVEAGGCVDINNVANKDVGVALTIAGKGILSGDVYSGAVKYSGTVAIGSNSRQISSLTLTADALVDVGAGWGLVHSGHATAFLNLNGHTLTMRGSGTVPMVKVDASSSGSGVIYLDGPSIKCGDSVAATDKSSNFNGIDIIANASAALDFLNAPTALGSLLIMPSNAGTSSSYWNLPEGLVPTVDTINVDSTTLAIGDSFDLLTVPSAIELTGDMVSVRTGGRYQVLVSGNKVTATVNALVPFLHYDFNAANSIAADSQYNCGNLNPTLVPARNGQAGKFVAGTTPWYDSNTSGKSPFYAGEMSVTALLKVKEASNTIIWNFGSGWSTGIALIAKDSTTIALVSWTGGAAGSDVVSVTGVSDLMNKWHLVTIVANASGTALYVDDKVASVDTVLPSGISGQGQFGSIHGTAKNYNAVSEKGFLLDDWCVYDAALTREEVRKLRSALLPDPFILRLR